MYIKTLLKQFIIVLLSVSATTAATINCKNFKSSNPDITVNECIENKKGKITSLYIEALITEELIEQIITLDALETFKFYHPSYKDDFDLAPLKKLKKLTTIDGDCYRHPKHKSSGSEIRKNSFDGLKYLKKLRIEGCEVMGEQPYKNLTNLEELTLQISRGWNNVPDLTYLKDNKKLTSLTLVNYYSSSRRTILTNLSELQSLKKIELSNFVVDQQKIDEISQLKNLEELDISPFDLDDNNINPNSLINLKDSIKVLVLNGRDGSFPECVYSFKNLKKLLMHGFDMNGFPEELTNLENLEYLDLYVSNGRDITSIPDSIVNLKKLEYLSISNGDITELPENIGDLKNLKTLIIDNSIITSLPASINDLENLKTLDISYNLLNEFPDLTKLTNLEQLLIRCNDIIEIPESITKLQSLKVFDISSCSTYKKIEDPSQYISEIPEFIKELKNLEDLSLAYQNIKEIPKHIIELENLKSLDLTNNFIVEVPEYLINLKNLQKLNLSYNDIKVMPEFLNDLDLIDVDFSYNANLTGKTLSKETISRCNYKDTKVCISNEKLSCINTNFEHLEPCEIITPECDEIEAYFQEKNINMEDITFSCKDNEDKKVKYFLLNEMDIIDEVLDKVLAYNTTEELKIKVDGSKNILEKIGKNFLNLKKLTISNEKSQSLNLTVLKNLKNLTYLEIKTNSDLLFTLKKGSLKYLTSLKEIHITNVSFTQTIIDEFGKLVNLEKLNFNSCNYPSDLNFDSFKELQKLKSISIKSYYEGKNPLQSIPSSFYYLPKLKELTITEQKIKKISSKISKLKKLEDLDLRGNNLTTLPDALNKLEDLKYVDFGKNPSLTGKTLTNENLRTCDYDITSSICKAVEMGCFEEDIKLCEN